MQLYFRRSWGEGGGVVDYCDSELDSEELCKSAIYRFRQSHGLGKLEN